MKKSISIDEILAELEKMRPVDRWPAEVDKIILSARSGKMKVSYQDIQSVLKKHFPDRHYGKTTLLGRYKQLTAKKQ